MGQNIKLSKENKKKQFPPVPPGRLEHDPTEDISIYYEITNSILGIGNFSTVKEGISKETSQKVAIKIVDKSQVRHKPEMLRNEVEILLKIEHPNVIRLIDLFDTPTVLYIVMELVTGGELFDRIVEREQYSETDAREVMRQLFSAIEYIHSKEIVHRDLKPENLLLADESHTNIKLTDFGLSRIYDNEYIMSTACGTPGYVAPEILKADGYGPAIDMWSSGVILYILLCGYPPFYHEDDAKLFESIIAANYYFHSPYWDNISKEAKNVIRGLLVPEPAKRLTATKALEMDWFKMGGSNTKGTDTTTQQQPLPEEMKESLQRHNTERKSMVQMAIQKNNANKKEKN